MAGYIVLLLEFLVVCCVYGFSVNDFELLFKEADCIEGTLSTLPEFQVPAVLLEQVITNQASLLNVSVASETSVQFEKSPAAQIHEISQFNKINFYYELIGEEGPAHNKQFKIQLILGDEKYVGEGPSVKKAKYAAALSALEQTKYFVPPINTKVSEYADVNTPTVQLNNAAQKLGIRVEYENLDGPPEEEEDFDHSYTYITDNNGKSYLTRLNYSIYHPSKMHVKSVDGRPPGQPFAVRVHVGDRNYLGIGNTIKAARHDGAAKAIDDMKRRALDEEEKYCTTEGMEKQCKMNKNSLKSPISVVYEIAQKRQLLIDFKIIEEIGKSHEKVFVTQCTLGDFVSKGKGKSKKESKKIASEEMLKMTAQLLPPSDLDKAVAVLKANKKKKNKKSKKLVRNYMDKLKMNTENMVSSVIDYVSDLSTFGVHETNDDMNKPTKISKSSKSDSAPSVSLTTKDELLRLTQFHNIDAQFSDFSNSDLFYSIVSLTTKPPHICFGKGATNFDSHENTSMRALKFLGKLGILLPDTINEKNSERIEYEQDLTLNPKDYSKEEEASTK